MLLMKQIQDSASKSLGKEVLLCLVNVCLPIINIGYS